MLATRYYITMYNDKYSRAELVIDRLIGINFCQGIPLICTILCIVKSSLLLIV